MKYDSNGIPILNANDIEVKTESFLRHFHPECLESAVYIPLLLIAKDLQASDLPESHRAKFIWNQDLGKDTNGNYYLGRFHIPSRTIYIAPFLTRVDDKEDPRFSFTLAHEMGHFVLHRDLRNASPYIDADDRLTDTKETLQLDRIATDNPRGWLEWQANRFAASLILPRKTLPSALIHFQRKCGLNERSFGRLFVDDQPVNQNDFHQILSALAQHYHTSKTVVLRRLQELSCLDDQRNKTSRTGGLNKVSDIFGGLDF